MDASILLAIAAIITAVLTPIVTVALAWIAASKRLDAVDKKQAETHDLVNSRLTEMLELTRTSARAEGKTEGKIEGLTEVAAAAKRVTEASEVVVVAIKE